jgi:hypothetical protein
MAGRQFNAPYQLAATRHHPENYQVRVYKMEHCKDSHRLAQPDAKGHTLHKTVHKAVPKMRRITPMHRF